MKISPRVIIMFIIIGLIFTCITPFFSAGHIISLENRSQMSSLEYGWPLQFVTQDINLEPPDTFFPAHFKFMTPQEHPTSINDRYFALSVVINGAIFAAVFIVLRGIETYYKRIRQYLHKHM